MIIVENKAVPTSIYIPKNIDDGCNAYVLKIVDRCTNKEYEFECDDTGTYTIWYQFTIDFSQCATTEYEYILTDIDDEEYVLSKGLIDIRDGKSELIAYETNTEYKAYNE